MARDAHLTRYEEMALLVDDLRTFPNKPQEDGHAGVMGWLDRYHDVMERARNAVTFVTDPSWVDMINTRMSGSHVAEVRYQMAQLKHALNKVQVPTITPPKEKFNHIDLVRSDATMEYAVPFASAEQLRDIILSKYMSNLPLPNRPVQKLSLLFGRTPTNESAFDGADVYDATIPHSTPTIYDLTALLQTTRDTTTSGLSHPIVKRLDTIRARSTDTRDAQIHPVVQKDGDVMTPVICPIPLFDMMRGPSRQIPAYHELSSSLILDPRPLEVYVPDSETSEAHLKDPQDTISKRHQKWERHLDMYRDFRKESLPGTYDCAMREFGLSALLQLEELKSPTLDKKLLPSHTSVKLQLIHHGATSQAPTRETT